MQATEISEKSSVVLSLKLLFSMANLSKTSVGLNLHVLSHLRFEKGILVATVNEALFAAASLIVRNLQVRRCVRVVSAGMSKTSDVEVFLQPADVNRVLGTELSYADVEDVFRRLGFGLSGNMDSFTVSESHVVVGITIAKDLFEEKLLISSFMTACQLVYQKTMVQQVLTATQKLSAEIRTLLEKEQV